MKPSLPDVLVSLTELFSTLIVSFTKYPPLNSLQDQAFSSNLLSTLIMHGTSSIPSFFFWLGNFHTHPPSWKIEILVLLVDTVHHNISTLVYAMLGDNLNLKPTLHIN